MYKKGRVNSNSRIISTDEDPSLRIDSSAITNLRGVSAKLNKNNDALREVSFLNKNYKTFNSSELKYCETTFTGESS